jgi:DNA-binding transcriptional ArsR family regulator
MVAVVVLDDPDATAAAVDPLRSRLLSLLATEPASAATLAHVVGEPRQKVTYHLKVMAEHDLVREVDQRRHGGITERRFRATAASYVISPEALGAAAADPATVGDRLSASYLLALAGRAIREVGSLMRAAAEAQQSVSTLSIDADIRFRDAAERAAFTSELAASVQRLAAKYHDEAAPAGRWHRFVAISHARPEEQ